MERNMSTGADSIDWADPTFSTGEYPDAMMAETPWNDFTNLGDYGDSPGMFGARTPSKAGQDSFSAAGAQQAPPQLPQDSSMSAESSSADSGSDSSSLRKRKTTSESPLSNPPQANFAAVKSEAARDTSNYSNTAAFQQTFSQPMPRLAVEQGMNDHNDVFDFNSAASSPNLPRDVQQLSLDAKGNFMSANTMPQYSQDSPVRTINPGMFLGDSRDQSPATNSAMFHTNTASPHAFFSTPSSDSNDTFNANQNWGSGIAQNPSWTADLTNQFASPGGLHFTPSPATNGGTPSMASRSLALRSGRSPLHIAPIASKSRVETQINVIMTVERPPPSVEYVHLPLHTIAKSKLLAKDEHEPSKILELHTMLVCSSAMHNPELKEKALQRAATQNNEEIQQRAERERELGDDEKNNMKNVDEADKPANGGEVRICNNCIQRERKRAGRKKLKKEEEQQHWERYETERVVVFNSAEYLSFKPYEQREQFGKDSGMGSDEPYDPPNGAISVLAAMRIACYCRHQSEKEGFQVIFTLKDHQGSVVGQEMSDSILITDDHKTHPPTVTPLSSDLYFAQGQFGAQGLPTSYSAMDLPSQAQPFTSSRSAGNLQALAYGQQMQFNPHSHIHQLPGSLNPGFVSGTTSATMTPTNLSRPGSPTLAGQAGPNKKRKSASFHKRVPSGLQMTPRVDTGQVPPHSATLSSGLSSGLPSGISMANLSPSQTPFGMQNDQSYMTIPNNTGQGQYFGSGPSTPANENTQFQFAHLHQLDVARAQNAAAYFSHPSSAVPSRSNSPVIQHSRPVMSAFPRQTMQTPPHQVNSRPNSYFGGQALAGVVNDEDSQAAAPTITKITPSSGPIGGGTEVSIFGYNFTQTTQVLFGDSLASTTFYGEHSILATSPPGRRGRVQVRLVQGHASMQYPSNTNNHIFSYTDVHPQMMEMALKYFTQQQTGDPGRWVQYTNEVANQFMATSISQAGLNNQGYVG